ncbi:LuxR C-terminal-related transcriptional regulator [Nocardia jejuensis]|uniref:LuxR C-terminal-related transcriptional regulator n=1 Tax=Nocardia jejuensis TaxID=328049 RepID=UPI00082C69D0|nr:helix-turn-helix transcriptional regulator [Nocardia jejuensis]
MLYGRGFEESKIRGLLDDAAGSSSGSLVVVSEPGLGKSALLEHAANSVDESWQVLRCTGVKCESELPFAGLQMLVGPLTAPFEALPERQADALRGALGVGAAPRTGDRFLVGLGMLALLAEISAAGPLLCLIDDAQWVDQPSIQALLFAARRLGDEPVVMLFAGREEFAAQGVPELRLTALDTRAARKLLADKFPELTPEIRDRVLAEAAGNPLALLEMPAMDLDLLPVGPLPLPDRLRSGYERALAGQPDRVRTALLVAAAEETGDLGLVLRVLAALGLTDEALAAAESTGMLLISEQAISFRHPLRRAAVYESADFTRRRSVHAAIAAAITEDADRRAWHLAAAANGPDEQVAAALEEAAEHARFRTGYATAAVALERSARLSPEPDERQRRLALAVEAAMDSGRHERALRLIADTEQTSPSPIVRARLTAARARIEIEHGSLRTAYELLTAGTAQVRGSDPDLAARMLVEAAHAAWTAGDLPAVAAVRARLAELDADSALLDLIDGPLALHSADPAAGVRLIRANAARTEAIPGEGPAIRLDVALQSLVTGDLDEARHLLSDLTTECRDRGMVGWLPAIGCGLGKSELLLGRFREAEAALTDALRIAEDIGQPDRVGQAQAILSVLAAYRGEDDRCRTLARSALRQADRGSNSVVAAHGGWALALLDLGYGRYEQALDRLEAMYRNPNHALGQWIHLMSDRVEAAARLRSPERAAQPLAILEGWLAATGSTWVQAHVLRCRGLLENNGELFAEAMKIHVTQGRSFDQARTGLLYGEWLRRERYKSEARAELRTALEIFERLRAEPWAERTRAELRAAGAGAAQSERAASDPAAVLTAQEFQVVQLAAAGATNKEIGARLFLSPKTVGNHLYRAYPKLGVTNRVELARLEWE